MGEKWREGDGGRREGGRETGKEGGWGEEGEWEGGKERGRGD